MKRLTLVCAILAAGSAMAAEKSTFKPATEDAKVGYSIGFLNGSASLEQFKGLDVESYVAGFRDARASKEGALNEAEMEGVLNAFRARLMQEAQADFLKQAEENNRKGAAYLAENGKKAGVKTTASGLQYLVQADGKGDKPKATDTVTVHYEGRLIDGTVFDSSRERGEPVTFQLDQVIKGWTEGLQLMSPGAKYQFVIPPALGYGEQGVASIPPNAVLVFDVELISVGKPKQGAAAPKKK